MTQPEHSSRDASSRADAAKLLRAARQASRHASADALHWFTGIMPDRLSAQRLEIDWLMDNGDDQAAEAAIARALLRNPRQPALLYRQACVHFSQGRCARAEMEITLVLAQRPHHFGAHMLAGRIARSCGNLDAASHHIEQAQRIRPNCNETTNEMAEVYLQAGKLERAESVLASLADPSPFLEARLLIARDRSLDACDLLRRSVPATNSAEEQDELLTLLIEQLERIGAYRELQQWIGQVDADRPRAMAAAAAALLRLGEAEQAMTKAIHVIRHHRLHRRALHVLVVAAALSGRRRLAERALARLDATNDGIDRALMAAHWHRGLIGQAVFHPDLITTYAENEPACLLPALIQQAADTFRVELKATHLQEPGHRDRIQRYLAICEAAGRQA